jgi:hypothetical protein
MDRDQEYQLNNAAYRRLKNSLALTYGQGRYIAFANGQVVADAAEFEELTPKLKAKGLDSPRVFVVQAGVDYPEEAIIFVCESLL